MLNVKIWQDKGIPLYRQVIGLWNKKEKESYVMAETDKEKISILKKERS